MSGNFVIYTQIIILKYFFSNSTTERQNTIFSLHHCWVQIGFGFIQPSNKRVLETLSLMVKRPGLEADHSPPSSAVVKNTWSYTSTLLVPLHSMVLN